MRTIDDALASFTGRRMSVEQAVQYLLKHGMDRRVIQDDLSRNMMKFDEDYRITKQKLDAYMVSVANHYQ